MSSHLMTLFLNSLHVAVSDTSEEIIQQKLYRNYAEIIQQKLKNRKLPLYSPPRSRTKRKKLT